MEERDDWRLGDEEGAGCPRCGKPNRAGLSYCAICGSPLGEGIEADPASLRTLGEAMGSTRRARRAPGRRRSLRSWTIAAGILLAIVVVLTWLQTREEPFLLEDWLAEREEPTPVAAPTDLATAVPPTRRPAPTPPPAPPPLVVAPPEPTATAVVRPTMTAVVRATTVPPPTTTPRPARTQGRPVVRPTAQAAAAPMERPLVQKPSLGTDLQEATRVYRRAVDLHNERVDEYNALADEIQRRNAWDDSEPSVELRRRLDRAREGVESARAEAEVLRTKMEALRARYR